MAKPLLERQASLIQYMTSGAAIFGGGEKPAPGLEGIDRALLQIEAKFSYAKRMEKIAAVLPRTFELLGSREPALVRAFVEACPPATLSRLENARQFHGFLVSRWERETPDPPSLRDVAACEIAFAEVDADPGRHESDRVTSVDAGHRGCIRRRPNVILMRCAYDVRPLFEAPRMRPPPSPPPLVGEGQGGGQGRVGERARAVPVRRDTPLVMAVRPGAGRPQVYEVIPAIFDLLAALDDWTDPSALPVEPDLAKLLADLAARGLIEVRQ